MSRPSRKVRVFASAVRRAPKDRERHVFRSGAGNFHMPGDVEWPSGGCRSDFLLTSTYGALAGARKSVVYFARAGRLARRAPYTLKRAA